MALIDRNDTVFIPIDFQERLVPAMCNKEDVVDKGCRLAEGMKILEKEPVDLVLLDLLMPDIDGFDAFRKLREKWPVPIVFITADKSIETIQKAVEIGADDYVTKPFLPIALKERIHGVIYSI